MEEALEGTENQSLYAQSLKLGHDFMWACSEYLEGNIDLAQAKKDTRQFEAHKQSLEYYVEQAKLQEKAGK